MVKTETNIDVVIALLLAEKRSGAKLDLPSPLTENSTLNGYTCGCLVQREFKVRGMVIDSRMSIQDIASPLTREHITELLARRPDVAQQLAQMM